MKKRVLSSFLGSLIAASSIFFVEGNMRVFDWTLGDRMAFLLIILAVFCLTFTCPGWDE